MTKEITLGALFYDGVYNDGIPNNQIFLHLFNKIPSIHTNNDKIYDRKILDFFVSMEFKIMVKNQGSTWGNPSSRQFTDSFLLFNNEKRMLVHLFPNTKTKDETLNITFLYDYFLGDILEQINFNEISAFEKPKKETNISLVTNENGYLNTEEYLLTVPEINLKLNYGENFIKKHNIIKDRLNTVGDTGIILLHGEPGTGKTSYIKYLTKLVEKKQILFIPPSMAEALSDPSIISFLMDYTNSILIIEDGEKVIGDRETTGSPIAVSNILNLTDGILGDCLKIQIIVTFNMKKERIDNALLRKGRLIVEHKFEKLSIQESNNLFKYLKNDYVTKEPMSLADIYNIDIELYKVENSNNKIGFSKK